MIFCLYIFIVENKKAKKEEELTLLLILRCHKKKNLLQGRFITTHVFDENVRILLSYVIILVSQPFSQHIDMPSTVLNLSIIS